VKLSALEFDAGLFAELDMASARTERPLHIDALSPETVDTTWQLLQAAPRAGQIGVTLPGRWRRSAADASLAERLGLRVRIIKGQWADPAANGVDPARGFLDVVDRMCGHSGGVGVATHDVPLLTESLRRLNAAGTPSTAELLFGMPFGAPARTARRLGVPIRVYVPYGRAGPPYGIADVTDRPVAAWWLVQDLVLGKDKTWLSIRRSRLPR
jgi:proline dehydrogenase